MQDNSLFWTEIKTFEEQLAKSPNSFCFARLSDVYLKVGLVDDALHTARQGVAKHPGYMGGQRALAMACHAKGLDDECLAALKLVTVAMPEDHQAQKLFGRLSAAAGDKDAARRALETVLEFVPDDLESRIALESIEVSEEAVPPFAYADEDDEEIIEDLELLEEIDVLEEDSEDFDFEEQEQEQEQEQLPTTEPETEARHDPLSTVTLAELYVKQGFIHKALEIYKSILVDDPGNSTVSKRISELELQDSFVVESSSAGDNAIMFESHEPMVSGYEADQTLRGNIVAVKPEFSALPELPLQEKSFFAAQDESVSAVLKPQGASDNLISTLEGWLENIRRVKSCR